MSSQQRFEVSAVLADDTSSGLTADEVAQADLNFRVVKYLISFALLILVTVISAIMVATSTPGFAEVSNEHRMNFLGCSLIAMMAPGIILPVKAKSPLFWVIYLLFFIPVVYMICA